MNDINLGLLFLGGILLLTIIVFYLWVKQEIKRLEKQVFGFSTKGGV